MVTKMELCQQSEGERQRETTRALPILAQTHVLQKICVESKFFAGEIKKKKKRRGYINLDNTKDL